MVIKRLSMVMFLLGALIAILGGSFSFIPETETITIITLIILGSFIGIMNISMEEENGFLIAGGVFIIASLAIIDLLSKFLLLDIIARILHNLIIFLAPACIVVAFRVIVEYASQCEWSLKKEEKAAVQIYRGLTHKERLWDATVLFAVALAFIILVLQLFFEIDQYQRIIAIIDGIIIAVFFVDLMILYSRVHDFRRFLKTSWLDIIAVIPLGLIFRLTKIVRFVRILERMSKAQKAVRMSKMNRPSKFFSESSERFEEKKRRK